MEIKLEPEDHKIIANMVAELVYERMLKKPARNYVDGGFEDENALAVEIEKTATEKVRELVTEEVKTQIAEVVTKRVTQILDTGLPIYDSYGRIQETATVEAYLRQMFERKVPQGYDTPKLSVVEKFVKDHLENEMGKSMKGELEAAKVQLKQAVDGLMKEKLAATLKRALGLD